ncbi:MAG: mammalian cell entry protein [Fibrobacteraceae bacterium]|jgi:ABC-type transporter Mla subunit MlaD|nr:mammalian cell entry protein [Fibrobacteraceae bacterium]MEE1276898.1 mammalian cell entry protein [Fibrobacteraceae bacterium]
MKIKISDKTIGYISFAFIIATITLVAIGMWKAHHATRYTATIDFQELGSLQPEDLATLRGYEVGVVREIHWLGDRARVTVHFNEPLRLREGTIFKNVNYALMGQRRLEIIASKTGKDLPEDYIHQGVFEPGIAEALRLIEDVVKQVEALQSMVVLVAQGDSTHPSFSSVFEGYVSKLEGLLQQTESLSKMLPEKLDNVFDVVDTTTKSINTITEQTNSAVNTIDSVAKEKIKTAKYALVKISDETKNANSLIDSFENSPIGELLENDSLIQKTNALIQSTQNLIKAFNTKGLDIRDENGNKVSLIRWENINLIGKTAREKAKLREELKNSDK